MKGEKKGATYVGKVVSDKMNKTRIVEITRVIRHKLYEKILRKRRKFAVDDSQNLSAAGDMVMIAETRPLSRTKYWKIVKILKKASSGEGGAIEGKKGSGANK